jgi:hypothetical protein
MQIHTRVWNYNKMNGRIINRDAVDDDDDDDGDLCRGLQDPSLLLLLCGGDGDGDEDLAMEVAMAAGLRRDVCGEVGFSLGCPLLYIGQGGVPTTPKAVLII